MADQVESVREKCVLIDNATREANDWRKRCMAIGDYICANFPAGHDVRNSVHDLINGRKRTEEQRLRDSQTLWTKLRDCREYAIRVREEGGMNSKLKDELGSADLWPPPHTDIGEIE
jgi:hypothetical protein